MTTMQTIYVGAHRRFWQRPHTVEGYIRLCRWAAQRWGEQQELMLSQLAMRRED